MAMVETNNNFVNRRVFNVEVQRYGIEWEVGIPSAFCVSVDDEIMIADEVSRVHVFSCRGDWLRSFGTPGTFKGQMKEAFKICASKSGNFVVVAVRVPQIKYQVYDKSGNFLFEFGKRDTKSCYGIAIDQSNNILVAKYIVEKSAKVSVIIYNSHGSKTKEIECMQVVFTNSIAVNKGLIFLTDCLNQCVQVYSYDGDYLYRIGGIPSAPYLNKSQVSVRITQEGNVLNAENLNNKLLVNMYRTDGTHLFQCFAKEILGYFFFDILSNGDIVVVTKENKTFLYEKVTKSSIVLPGTANLDSSKVQTYSPQRNLWGIGSPVKNQLQGAQQNIPAPILTGGNLVSDVSLVPFQSRTIQYNAHILSTGQHPECGGSQVNYQQQQIQQNIHVPHQQQLVQQNIQVAAQQQHLGLDRSQETYYQQQLVQQHIQAPTQQQLLDFGSPQSSNYQQQIQQNSAILNLQYQNQTRLPIEQRTRPPFLGPEGSLSHSRQNVQDTSQLGSYMNLSQQNFQNLGYQAASKTQNLNLQSEVPQSPTRLPTHISVSTFTDPRSRELGLHRPVRISNNNNSNYPLVQPQRYDIYSHQPAAAVPLDRHSQPPAAAVSFPDVNARRMMQIKAQQVMQEMVNKFDEMSLPAAGGVPQVAQALELIDVSSGPLAENLKAPVDLDATQELTGHPLYSPTRGATSNPPSFQAMKVQDPDCALPLRFEPAFAAKNPASSANTKYGELNPPSRSRMTNSGYLKDFHKPCAVATDSQDNVIVIDSFNNTITVYDKFGKKLFSFGETGSETLVKPRKVATDPETRAIVVLERTSVCQIKIFDKSGKFENSFLCPQVSNPRAMTVSKNSEIAIVQFNSLSVVMYDLSGQLLRALECEDFKSPTGIAVGQDELFISDSTDNCVKVYNFSGQLIHTFSDGTLTPSAIGVAIASNGDVAVVDTKWDFRLTLFSSLGIYTMGYYSEKKHRNFEGFALTSTDDVFVICDDGKLWYYRTHRSPNAPTFCPERLLTSTPRRNSNR